MHEALQLLQEEHDEIRDLCAELQELITHPPRQADKSGNVSARLKAALLIHLGLEDAVLQPASNLAPAALRARAIAIEEHHTLRWIMGRLQGEPEPHQARWLLLMELAMRHLRREERDIFPAMRKGSPGQLTAAELGRALELMRLGIAQTRTEGPRALPEAELADPARKRTTPLMPPRPGL